MAESHDVLFGDGQRRHRSTVKRRPGTARARLLRLLEARLAPLIRSALPVKEAAPVRAQPLSGILERAVSHPRRRFQCL